MNSVSNKQYTQTPVEVINLKLGWTINVERYCTGWRVWRHYVSKEVCQLEEKRVYVFDAQANRV